MGPGQPEIVTADIYVDAFEVEKPLNVVAHLIPTEGGAYTIQGGTAVVDGPRTFTGSYVIQGPTETATGTFTWHATSSPAISYSRILTALYPSNMVLQANTAATWSGGEGNLIQAVVDGHPVNMGISSVSYDMSFPVLVPAGYVPEPGAWAMLAGLVFTLGCGLLHHRHGVR